MNYILSSPYFQFSLNPKKATWSLFGAQKDAPAIEDAWMRVSYRLGRNYFDALQNWREAEIHELQTVASRHGDLQKISIALGPDQNGVSYTIEFAISNQYPLFLWRFSLDNQGEEAIQIDRLQLMQAGFFPKRSRLPTPGGLTNRYTEQPKNSGTIRPHPELGDLAFFSNGWQSWSFTGALGTGQSFPLTRLGFLTTPIWYNPGTPRVKKQHHFASDMFGVFGDRRHRQGILAGFLSQKQHFGSLAAYTDSVYPALALWANGDQACLQPGKQISTDWAVIQFVDIDDVDPLAPYLEAVAREHALPPIAYSSRKAEGVRLGWCSWYQFFQDISEEKMRANLQKATEIESTLPFDLFQIDDGYQAQVGDWLEFSPEFPHGVKGLATDIRKAGFTPGIWLAPFIVHSKAKLKRQHPDWLLRNRLGRPVNAGFIWNNINTALDLTHPEALDYVREVIHTAAHEWGYSFLKLDFLYAAAIQGRYHDKTKTRAQVLRMGLKTLRDAAGPDVHLLGCGVPLGSAIGLFETMRIGADVDQRWEPYIKGSGTFLYKEFSVPSARNAIQNTLTRAPMHLRWWINDPDCLLVRPDSQLTLAEVQSLATAITLTGGPLLLSDDLMPNLPSERIRIAKQMVPLIGHRGRVLDWFDETTPRLLRLDLDNQTGNWHLIAIFNWADEAQDFNASLARLSLAPGAYFAREFWSDKIHRISNGELNLKNIPAHGVKLLALRSVQPERASYLGSDLHISQGLEITQWSETNKNLSFCLERPGKIQGHIDLNLLQTPSRVTINQKEIEWHQLDTNIYRLEVECDQIAEIEIN